MDREILTAIAHGASKEVRSFGQVVWQILDDNSDYNKMDEEGSRYNYAWNAAAEEEKNDVFQAREVTAEAERAVEQSAASSETGRPSATTVVQAEQAKTHQRIAEATIVATHGNPDDQSQANHDIQKLTQNEANLNSTEREMVTATSEAERWNILRKNHPETAARIEGKLGDLGASAVGPALPGKGIKTEVTPTADFKDSVLATGSKGPAPASSTPAPVPIPGGPGAV